MVIFHSYVKLPEGMFMGSSWILLPGPLPQSSSQRLDPRGNHDVSICKEAPCEDWSDKKRHIRKKKNARGL